MHTHGAISCELLLVQPELVPTNVLSMNHWNLTDLQQQTCHRVEGRMGRA